MKFYLQPFFVLSFIFFPLVTFPADWSSWIKKYASNSPLLAINKTSSAELAVPDSAITQVLSGKTLFKFAEPVTYQNRNVLEFDLFEDKSARRLNTFDQIDSRVVGSNALDALNEETRYDFMIEASYKAIADRKDDELLIMHMGATHALDVYFGFFLKDKDKIRRDKSLQRQKEILYVSLPVSSSTTFFTPEYYDLLLAVDGVSTPVEKIGNSQIDQSMFYLSRLYFYHQLKKEGFSLEKLKDEKLDRIGTLIFMDTHYLNSTSAYSEMPSAEVIKRSGFKSVRVANESWIAGKNYELKDLEKIYRTPNNPRLRDFEIEFLKKKKPAVLERYQKGMVVYPAYAALHKKLLEYERAGIKITLTGLEQVDRFQ